jgi:hypothetical protein
MRVGIYLVLASMGIQLLLPRRSEHKIPLFYSIAMLVLTTTWFILTTRTNEIVMVEERHHQEYKVSLYCSPTNVASVALSSVQIIGSDLLLVS